MKEPHTQAARAGAEKEGQRLASLAELRKGRDCKTKECHLGGSEGPERRLGGGFSL